MSVTKIGDKRSIMQRILMKLTDDYGNQEGTTMNYTQYILTAKDAISLEEANDIFTRLQHGIDKNDEDIVEFYNDFIEGALEYASIRGGWLLLSKDEKMEQDKGRTIRHDSVITRINILARYLESIGKDISWRKDLGDSRKRIGDFACYVALFYGLSAR